MRFRTSVRVILGAAVSLGMLAVVPSVVLAADPACGDTITTNTTLTADLDCSGYSGTALTLGATGITLDLGGHTITGPAGNDSYTGVYTTYNGDTITDGAIADYAYGVDVSHAKNDTVSWLNVTGEDYSNDTGIYVEGGIAPAVAHNTISGEYYGISLYGNTQAAFNHNDSTASEYAFEFEYDSNDMILHNNGHAPYGFVDYYSSGQTYMNNTSSGNSDDGFYLECDDYGRITVVDNTANGNGGDGFYTEACYNYGRALNNPSLIKGNTAVGNGDSGFDDDASIGALFTKNISKQNATGFYFDVAGKMTLTNNIAIQNSNAGMELEYSGSRYGRPKTISGNTFRGNYYGVYADQAIPDGVCHGNLFKNNTTNTVGIDC